MSDRNSVRTWTTPEPFCIAWNATAREAYEQMADREIRRLPVLDGGGILAGRAGGDCYVAKGDCAMSATSWVAIDGIWCERVAADVELLERRAYPAEFMPDTVGYRVLARRCTCDMACNLAEFPCKWAFTRPEVDPFLLS